MTPFTPEAFPPGAQYIKSLASTSFATRAYWEERYLTDNESDLECFATLRTTPQSTFQRRHPAPKVPACTLRQAPAGELPAFRRGWQGIIMPAMSRDNTQQAVAHIIGLIPMAGRASRLQGIDCSKEIHPVNLVPDGMYGRQRLPPVAVCEHLLAKLRQAAITQAYIILREGKWDIPTCLGDGTLQDVNLAYLMMNLPHGVPYSLNQAYPFVADSIVALGFPDMVFAPGDLFTPLIEHLQASRCEVVLGLFPANRPDKVDMVDVNTNGRINRLIIKPGDTTLTLTWGVAVWTPVFSRFMNDYLESHCVDAESLPELHVGDVFNAAIARGLRVDAVKVSDMPYLDIGTQEDLEKVK